MDLIIPSDRQIIYLIALMLGVIIQVRLSLGGVFKIKDYAFFGFLFLISFLPSDSSGAYSIVLRMLFFLFLVCVYLAVEFKEKLLPRFSETLLLQMFIILIYSLSVIKDPVLFNLLGILTIIILPILFYTLFTKRNLNKIFKILSYVWFILVNTLVMAYLSEINLNYLLKNERGQEAFENILKVTGTSDRFVTLTLDPSIILYSFFVGLSLLFLTSNFVYLTRLIPFPSKSRSFQQALDDSKELISSMLAKFEDVQINMKITVLLILIQGGFLALNGLLQILDPATAIVISIFLVEFILYSKLQIWKLLLTVFGLIVKTKI